jgi:signal transduction histidine kinase
VDSLNSNAAAPDPRDQLRRFVDTLPWCVDFDLALTQFVRLAVEALRLGSFRVYVQNLEEDGYALRKSSADESAEGLEGDTALIRFFQNVEANCLTAEPREGDGPESEAIAAARAQLKTLRAHAAFAFRARGELAGLALARASSPEGPLGEGALEALEAAVSEFDRVAPELLQAERAALLGRMSSGVAHDLKSCFVSLSTLLQLCEEDEPRLDRIKELLPAARRNLETAQEIISQTQAAGRSDVFRGRPVDLAKVIRLALELAEPDLGAAGVSSAIDAPEGLVVAGVEVLLVRLLRNLLANAVRVSPRGGVVRIRTEASDGPDGPRAMISVVDEGPGMSDEIRRKALSAGPVDLSLREGLGLAICRELTGFHGGGFFIKSGTGRGTAVRVSLPSWQG